LELAIDIENLIKTYPGGFKALDGVNLQVEAGRFLLFWVLTERVKLLL
jgi:ABC-type multidrug transport system ATPase subunit